MKRYSRPQQRTQLVLYIGLALEGAARRRWDEKVLLTPSFRETARGEREIRVEGSDFIQPVQLTGLDGACPWAGKSEPPGSGEDPTFKLNLANSYSTSHPQWSCARCALGSASVVPNSNSARRPPTQPPISKAIEFRPFLSERSAASDVLLPITPLFARPVSNFNSATLALSHRLNRPKPTVHIRTVPCPHEIQATINRTPLPPTESRQLICESPFAPHLPRSTRIATRGMLHSNH